MSKLSFLLPAPIKRRLAPTPKVNVVRLSGTIMSRQGGLNDQSMAPVLQRAFTKGKPVAVALAINSPGGSPVQSSLIAARISRLAREKDIPVYAFVEDVAASGGYWLACSASEIYVDHSSIVGSIGVISAGFGFDKLIAQYGVERRVYASGGSKSQLDPFKPEKAADVKRLKSLQEDIHEAFIAHVTAARGDRLAKETPLFDGSFWTGGKGVELGLADHIGHLIPVMKDKFGEKTRFAAFGPKRPLFRRFGSQLAQSIGDEISDTTLWSRYGL